MKTTTRHFLGAALAALLLQGCNFLNVEQIGKSDIEGYFSEPSAAQAAVYGLLNLTYSLADKYVLLYPEVASDELVLSSSESTWALYQDFATTSDDETGALGYIWKNGYQIINNANQIISHAPALREQYPTQADLMDACTAQALFIRAYAHLCLCLCFGQNYTYTSDASHPGVPVITKALSLSEPPSRQSVAEVYAQITADLEEALQTFPESAGFDRFYPSALASKALLARVSLYMERWADAEKYAGEVIAQKSLTPRGSYVAMFNAMSEPADDEMILTLGGYKSGKSSSHTMYWRQQPKARPSERVTDLIPEGDVRTGVVCESGEAVCLKFDQQEGATDAYSNIPVLRVSEMYLIRAEALLRQHDLSGAAADLEALQSRAMGTAVTLPAMSEEEMDTAIEQERIKELCFEGHRLWDITRRHRNLVRTPDHTSSLSTLEYPDYRFVLPIPSVELEANTNIENNPTDNG